MRSRLCSAAVWLVACQAAAPAPNAAATHRPTSAPVPTATAEPPAADAGVPDAEVADDEPPGVACVDYEEAMRRGAELGQRGKWRAAVRAYDSAVRRKPFDAQARFERGRARLELGQPNPRDFVYARTFSDVVLFEREAWMLQGRAYELLGEAEPARLAYAVALAQGFAPAADQLGTRSKCTATWKTAEVEDAEIVRSWLEVQARRDLVGCEPEAFDDARTELEARRSVCSHCSGGGQRTRDDCRGAGPWRIQTGYMHCSTFMLFVQRLGGGKLFVQRGFGPEKPLAKMGAGWALDLGTTPEFEWNSGDFWELESELHEQAWSNLDSNACPIDATGSVGTTFSSGCQSSLGVAVEAPRVRRYFDRNGRGLLEVHEHAGDVQVVITGARATLTGAGCQEQVPLSAAP